jgi:hypothetical protein
MALQVIGLGLGRTGTHSLKLALEQLGFGPCYHMDTLLARPDDVRRWRDIDRGGHTDYRQLFGAYRSAVDFPTVAYHPDLLRRFPRAKCILTVRDEEEWYRSARATIMRAEPSLAEKVWLSFKLPFSRRQRRLLEVFRLTEKFWPFGGSADAPGNRAAALSFYHNWNDRIEATIPRHQLLIYEVSEGWEPLCKFLEVPVPDIPFPASNQRTGFKRKYRKLMGVE